MSNTPSSPKSVNKTVFLLFIFGIILSSYAFAVIDIETYPTSLDFTLGTASLQTTACACGQKTDSITIANTGSFAAVFSVVLDDYSGKITLSQNTLELMPGESREVYIYYSASCSPTKEDYTITVSSNLGPKHSITKSIATQKCQNVELWLTNAQQEVDPCMPATFTLYVKNTGTFTETYRLESDIPSNVRLTAESFVLAPNQIALVNATAQFDCKSYGDKNITFRAIALKNSLAAEITARMSIRQLYGFDVTINGDNQSIQSIDVCNRLYDTRIPITISNKGVANSFTIKFDHVPGFVSIEGIEKSNRLALMRGENKTIYLSIDTHEFRSEAKKYEISMSVSEELDDVKKTFLIGLNTKPCYEHSIDIVAPGNSEANPKQVCAGVLDSYDVIVSNKGTFSENIALSLDGAPSTFALSSANIRLGAGESTTLKLFIPGPDTNYLYNVKVNARLSNGLEESDSVWVQSNTQYSCYKTALKTTDIRVNYDTRSVSIPVRNAGVMDGSYVLNLSMPPIASLETTRIDLKAGESKEIRLAIDPVNRSEGTYAGNITLSNIAASTTYLHPLSITLKDKAPLTKLYEFFAFGSQCRQLSMYGLVAIIIVCLLIAAFMIWGPHYPYKFWNRVGLKLPILFVLAAIFIIGLALVLIFAGLPKSQSQVYNLTQNNSALRYEMVQGTRFTLDASQFFSTPEKTKLSYSASEIKSITTRSSGNMITFYPEGSFVGTRTFTITATDPQGGSATSPNMTLVVRPRPGMSTAQWYDVYCWYINLAILFLLLILIFLAFIVKQQRRARKYRP